MKCKDCRYLTPKAPLPSFPKLIGYCTETHHLGEPCFTKDECPEDPVERRI